MRSPTTAVLRYIHTNVLFMFDVMFKLNGCLIYTNEIPIKILFTVKPQNVLFIVTLYNRA